MQVAGIGISWPVCPVPNDIDLRRQKSMSATAAAAVTAAVNHPTQRGPYVRLESTDSPTALAANQPDFIFHTRT